MKSRLILIAAVCLVTTGCVQHQWAAGPDAQIPFGRASGQCKLVAMGAGGGGFVGAAGSPKFVAITMGAGLLAGAIGSAVRQQNAYNACLEAQGFVTADAPQSVAP
jgi:hypothetical protein